MITKKDYILKLLNKLFNDADLSVTDTLADLREIKEEADDYINSLK